MKEIQGERERGKREKGKLMIEGGPGEREKIIYFIEKGEEERY